MRHSFLQKHIDYILIFAFFAIPPVFSTGEAEYSPAAPVLALFVHAALCAYIICKTKLSNEKAHVNTAKIDTAFVLRRAAAAILALCMLMANSFAWNAAASAIASSGVFSAEQSEFVKIVPEGAADIAYSVLSLFVAALYEELLYRRFFPGELKYVFESDSPIGAKPQLSKILRIAFELAIILLFALGHRYLGVWAVLNAFTAGCVLRFFCIRTGSVISGFVAHFAYNLLMLFVF